MPTTLKDVPGTPPHGGALELRLAAEDELDDLRARAGALPSVETSARRVLSDLELFSVGAVSPNRGFMSASDYNSVVEDMHLASGIPWSLPITLSATVEEASRLEPGEQAAIVYEGRPVAIVRRSSRTRRPTMPTREWNTSTPRAQSTSAER